MGFSCGIVGLPNVGKSTLFNALTKAGVPSSNYPFCTIDANVGIVNVPDDRLYKLSELVSTKKITPTTVKFIDIAGLVEGASENQGKGNQFLNDIRGVDAIIQVVRLFEDENVVHIGDVDPVRDIEIINLELILKDLESVEGILGRRSKVARSGDSEARAEVAVLEKVKKSLEDEKMVRNVELSNEEKKVLKPYQLLTAKELFLVGNIGESELQNYKSNGYYQKMKAKADELQCDTLVLCAKIEQEISELDEEESREYLKELGEDKSGLEKLIIEGYGLLGLITFFTAGEKETRAWTVRCGTKAPQAAGVIHTDMEKGFIRMEVAGYQEFVDAGSWSALKEKGRARLEGKDYEVRDGDVIIVRFNV